VFIPIKQQAVKSLFAFFSSPFSPATRGEFNKDADRSQGFFCGFCKKNFNAFNLLILFGKHTHQNASNKLPENLSGRGRFHLGAGKLSLVRSASMDFAQEIKPGGLRTEETHVSCGLHRRGIPRQEHSGSGRTDRKWNHTASMIV